MDFLHKKLLQATTKDQEDKIVDWMLAEAKVKTLLLLEINQTTHFRVLLFQ